jgi:ribose 5-phosphate isomerase B
VRFLIGTDEARPIVEHLAQHLRAKGHHVDVAGVRIWGAMATHVATEVANGHFDQGIVCCWTGTGASIAANKVPGIRAALCVDAETARGARAWNDANVLALSLRLLSDPVATEILDAWLSTAYAGTEDESLAFLAPPPT